MTRPRERERARVAVLGGGVAGLSAAHELAERGYEVTVYERNERFGGKARSFPGPTGSDGRPLPAEHGFRFFPGFYRHVTDTMARTPVPDGRGAPTRTVADHLVSTEQMLQAVTDGDSRIMITDRPRTLAEWRDRLGSLFAGPHVPPDESAFFVDRLLTLLTSCEARWDEEYERTPWWEFVNAGAMSEGYQKFLGYGVTQSLVAMRPEVSSTRTIGRIYLQMIRGLFDDRVHADRLLDGPTNDVWIDPWVDYLRDLGVTFHTNATITGLECDCERERITGVTLERERDGSETETRVESDYYVLAVPVDIARRLVTPELEAAAPSLADLDRIDTAWMNGLQFYLAEDVPTVRGHGVFYDSPWALTSISQRQFWSAFDRYGGGDVEGILSVIVSEWDEPGIVYGKPARECTEAELETEVWEQLKRHLNREEPVLTDDLLVDSFVDPALAYDEEAGVLANDEPLLINTVGTRQYRPPADTEIPNLVLAGDYVRTETDLASMEAANEAARRAVNAILEREGDTEADRCQLWSFDQPRLFEPARRHDELNWRLGLPHPGAASPVLWEGYRRLSDGPRAGLAALTRGLSERK
ncbi:FAD-dependent oxidoreductase [Halobacteria archaeon AArc-m2/3/4]|uniref:FAD-dependent oxidoreductase n=1 Tax=Natronoglomus mannanivorans TaxID=2979990 RepID=A0ABT2QHT3_9EURY|nr:FAD-dependent oxidoreductase [Halobacteria archaeon AArc-m2/3/4]